MTDTIHAEVFVICDKAEIEPGEFLTISKVFNSISWHTFPLRVKPFYLATRVRFDSAEKGKHVFEFAIFDADGAYVQPRFMGEVTVDMPPGVVFAWQNLVIPFGETEFRVPGDYEVKLIVDGEPIASVPFIVTKTVNEN